MYWHGAEDEDGFPAGMKRLCNIPVRAVALYALSDGIIGSRPHHDKEKGGAVVWG